MENQEYEYTIEELFEMLKADESWEADEATRIAVANALYGQIMR